jgi:hypothetical protein
MSLPPEVLTILVLLAVALGGFALFVVVNNVPKGNRKLADDKQAVVVLTRHDQELSRLKLAIRQLGEEHARTTDLLTGALQRVGLVRYDAFEDMGGHLSFSAAFLDADGNGLVITSINGRQDTRCYAKPVEGWSSRHNLSGEEEQAIQQALTSTQPALPVHLAADARGGRRGA